MNPSNLKKSIYMTCALLVLYELKQVSLAPNKLNICLIIKQVFLSCLWNTSKLGRTLRTQNNVHYFIFCNFVFD